MRASAVICTLNRRAPLLHAVRSLMRQTFPRDEYEVIVVDNGSTDGSREAIERAMEAAANLRYVCEPRTGLSLARNRGIREARGRVVAFLDDDAEAAPHWLASLWAVYAADADVGGVGGPVFLRWPHGRPAWLPAGFDHRFSAKDEGTARKVLTFPSFLFGTNMSVRRDLLIRLGGFSPRLGRVGGGLVGHEERELFARLDRHGVKIVYEPAAVVLHHISPDRCSPWWLLRRAFAAGRSSVLFDQHVRAMSRTYWLRQTVQGMSRAGRDAFLATWAALMPPRAQRALIYASRASEALGRTRESLAAMRSSADPRARW
jgi:glycosyltransferase involved in cell wall biosynthesis